MIFHEQPTDPWNEIDFRLLEAYQIIEQETCAACGQPIWLCRSEDRNLTFELHTTTCYGDKRIKEWTDKQNKKKKPSHGELPWLKPCMIRFDEEGKPYNDYENLPTRKDYYAAKVVNEDG